MAFEFATSDFDRIYLTIRPVDAISPNHMLLLLFILQDIVGGMSLVHSLNPQMLSGASLKASRVLLDANFRAHIHKFSADKKLPNLPIVSYASTPGIAASGSKRALKVGDVIYLHKTIFTVLSPQCPGEPNI